MRKFAEWITDEGWFVISITLITLIALALVIAVTFSISRKMSVGETMERMDVGGDYSVYQHKETGVYYIIGDEGACVMVNPDGTPYTGE